MNRGLWDAALGAFVVFVFLVLVIAGVYWLLQQLGVV